MGMRRLSKVYHSVLIARRSQLVEVMGGGYDGTVLLWELTPSK